MVAFVRLNCFFVRIACKHNGASHPAATAPVENPPAPQKRSYTSNDPLHARSTTLSLNPNNDRNVV